MRREPCASLQISVTGALWYDWKILLSGAYCQLLILSQPARSQLDRNLSCQLPCWATPQNTLPVAVVIKYSHTLHMGMRRDLSSILNYHLLTHTSREWRKLEFLEVFHSYFACVAGHSLSVYSAGWLKIVHFIFFFSAGHWQLSLSGNLWLLLRVSAWPSLGRPHSCNALQKEVEHLLFRLMLLLSQLKFVAALSERNWEWEGLNASHKKGGKSWGWRPLLVMDMALILFEGCIKKQANMSSASLCSDKITSQHNHPACNPIFSLC